jgi:glycosyltransferase involved in cell wall biosynthesis
MLRFRPVPASMKADLRARHGLSEDQFIVLHAGHINVNRNVEVLSRVQQLAGCQAILLGSTSTPQDAGLVGRLRESGVLVVTEYLERVEEWYQLADCYLFPVLSATGSIEIPLSVLEAMACDLPVVTTRYGGLAEQFPGAKGLLYADDGDGLVDLVTVAMSIEDAGTRALVEPFTWETVLSNTVLAEDR